MSSAETIGERLRRLRDERGFTQRDLASPGVTPQYISRIERGERTPSVKALRKLAAKLDVSAELLEGGADPDTRELRAFQLTDAELALRLGGEPAELEEVFSSLLREATASHDVGAQARASLGLGLLAARRGDHGLAVEQLELACDSPFVTPAGNPSAYATLAHSLVALGREQDAIVVLRRCIAELDSQVPVDHAALTRFATYLSYALVDAGSLDEARQAIELALLHGGTSDDSATRVRLHWAKARFAASEGELGLATVDIARAIALLETSEDSVALARAHLIAAEIVLWEGNPADAEDHLAAAEGLLPDGATLEDRAFLLVQQAFVAARLGRAALALDKATCVLRLLGSAEDSTVRGRAYWALAEAYAAAGAIESARAAFATAGELIPPGSKHAARLLQAWEQLAVPR